MEFLKKIGVVLLVSVDTEISESHQEEFHRIRSELFNKCLRYYRNHPSIFYQEPKLRVDLDTGNIFRDALPFLFQFRYDYPRSQRFEGKSATIKIRRPNKFSVGMS